MGVNRRDFCKIAGAALLGVAGRPAASALAGLQIKALGPLTAKRWGMLVDLAKCRRQDGCRDCIDACHTVHNVPDFSAEGGDPKHVIKWIWKETYEHAFPEQHHEFLAKTLHEHPLPVLCNHCDNPPCVRVCPTQATWKREDGIVMMDWHRCIGCRYCVAACPYGSRSFNWRDPRPHIDEIDSGFATRTRGVVEKCTFCDERLDKGQLRACVEACQHGCLIFGDLADDASEVREVLRSRHAIRRKPALGNEPEVYYLV